VSIANDEVLVKIHVITLRNEQHYDLRSVDQIMCIIYVEECSFVAMRLKEMLVRTHNLARRGRMAC
jgi:phage terminase large subunit